ncbi:MAG: nitrite reductase small subunit NirD [Fibrobacteres bacterium]|nr:nitrite reductase small subunit NirD [Fibrobacterota bacterium]
MLQETISENTQWIDAGCVEDLSVGAGTCVLVEGRQVAVFRVDAETFRAVQNQCPHKGAAVMHQGIVADRSGEAVVLCPLHKRGYHLGDGRCMEEGGPTLRVYTTKVEGERLMVSAGL